MSVAEKTGKVDVLAVNTTVYGRAERNRRQDAETAAITRATKEASAFAKSFGGFKKDATYGLTLVDVSGMGYVEWGDFGIFGTPEGGGDKVKLLPYARVKIRARNRVVIERHELPAPEKEGE